MNTEKPIDKIILAFDSFKGSASSGEVAEAARRAIVALLPHCRVLTVPIADGGEGTVEAICRHRATHAVWCTTHDPLMNELKASYHISSDGQTAIMEMAAASGLPLVPIGQRNPLLTTTYGTGEMMADAIAHGCRTIVMGIGGSATNDAGIGALRALGFRFVDNRGADTTTLSQIARIDESKVPPQVADCKFYIICDVNNPFYGKHGAAYVYAPQKGADDAMVELLDNGLRNFAAIVRRDKGIDLQQVAGSGAAGGMGGGLYALLRATLMPGVDTLLEITGFRQMLAGTSLVITGEGRIDSQTAMGKALGGIVRVAHASGVPVIAIGGSVADDDATRAIGFDALLSIQSGPIAETEAMRKETTLRNVARTVEQIIRIKLA